jgi:chromosome partitioning protein
MAKIFCIANQKGGVGKTTTAIHLAHGLCLAGQRVALFDLDPQGNATVALQGMLGSDDAPPGMPLEGLDALGPAFWMLPSAGASLARGAKPDVGRLNELVDQLAPQLDWLVVDCPPRMDEWGWAGVQIAEQVLVPVQAEFFAMHGLSQMLATLEAASAEFPGKAVLRGVLPTMVDLREPIATEVLDDLRKNLGRRLLDTVILRDASLVEAASFGISVYQHLPFSKGALCYAELVKELLDG